MSNRRTLLNGRWEVRKVGCGHCGRGTDAVEFHDTYETCDTQRLTGEVAEWLWPLIESEANKGRSPFGH